MFDSQYIRDYGDYEQCQACVKHLNHPFAKCPNHCESCHLLLARHATADTNQDCCDAPTAKTCKYCKICRKVGYHSTTECSKYIPYEERKVDYNSSTPASSFTAPNKSSPPVPTNRFVSSKNGSYSMIVVQPTDDLIETTGPDSVGVSVSSSVHAKIAPSVDAKTAPSVDAKTAPSVDAKTAPSVDATKSMNDNTTVDSIARCIKALNKIEAMKKKKGANGMPTEQVHLSLLQTLEFMMNELDQSIWQAILSAIDPTNFPIEPDSPRTFSDNVIPMVLAQLTDVTPGMTSIVDKCAEYRKTAQVFNDSAKYPVVMSLLDLVGAMFALLNGN
jgi:hypothetical protein